MAAAGSAEGGADLPPKILNITVPQVGHLPLMALRAFFMVSSTASTISFLALHLTQYPSGIKILPLRRFMPRGSYWIQLRWWLSPPSTGKKHREMREQGHTM